MAESATSSKSNIINKFNTINFINFYIKFSGIDLIKQLSHTLPTLLGELKSFMACYVVIFLLDKMTEKQLIINFKYHKGKITFKSLISTKKTKLIDYNSP